jgi:hypothetical protein
MIYGLWEKIQNVWEQGAHDNIWTKERDRQRKMWKNKENYAITSFRVRTLYQIFGVILLKSKSIKWAEHSLYGVRDIRSARETFSQETFRKIT